MLLALGLSLTDWFAWIGFEALVAAVVFLKSVVWFRRAARTPRTALLSWEVLLLLAFFGALGIGEWRHGGPGLATMIGFLLAGAMILSAAVNAAYQVGLARHTPNIAPPR